VCIIFERKSKILARAKEKDITAPPSPVSAPAKILATAYHLCRRRRKQRVPSPRRVDLIGAVQNLMQASPRWRLCSVWCIEEWRIPASHAYGIGVCQNLAWLSAMLCLALAKTSTGYIECTHMMPALRNGSRSSLLWPWV
jgi:hypothetical protein